MSRHGYVEYDDLYEDPDQMYAIWQAEINAGLSAKGGQAFVRDLVAALDAMPVKELHPHNVSGECLCAMGVVGKFRNVDLTGPQAELDDEDGDHAWATELTGDALGIADALSREVAYQNDEGGPSSETPSEAWSRMRKWASARIEHKGGE